VPEPIEVAPDDVAAATARAAEDQAIAAARHVAECVVRYHQVLVEGGLPPGLIAKLIRDWHLWFVTDSCPDCDDDDDDD
jgi:hypothetical protein